MPTDAPPRRETAGLITGFVKVVGDYLAWGMVAHLDESLRVPTTPGSPAEAQRVRELMEREGRRMELRAEILSVGPALAAALEAHGSDSTAVLRVMHAVDGGGGREAVARIWPDAKVALQRAAIQFGNDKHEYPATPNEADDAERQAPPLTKNERLVLIALAEFDASILASVGEIAEAMPPATRIASRTIGPAVTKLVAIGLAERPEGDKHGTRLTLPGRRLARKLAS